MLWRRLAVALLATAAMSVLLPASAGAHTYTGSYTYRLYGCSGDQACQAHYLLSIDDPYYGPLWKIQHTHGCTTKDTIYTKWVYMDFRVKDHGGTTVWSSSGHNWNQHEHTSQWCGQSAGSHDWYPNTFVPRGNNSFQISTSSYFADADDWYTYSKTLANI